MSLVNNEYSNNHPTANLINNINKKMFTNIPTKLEEIINLFVGKKPLPKVIIKYRLYMICHEKCIICPVIY